MEGMTFENLEEHSPSVLAGCRTAINFLRMHRMEAEAKQLESALVMAECWASDDRNVRHAA